MILHPGTMTSTAEPDYWSLLGVNPDCTNQQLKRAFRREARRWHPDLNRNDPVAEERFKLVNEAYAVLSDPRRRDAWQRGEASGPTVADPFADEFPDFEDYLDVIFGAGSARSAADPEPHRDPSSFRDEGSDDARNDARNSEPPVSAPPPPPPVRAVEDLESLVHLTPDQALNGTLVELTLDDGTVIELNTPPFAGDGWRCCKADLLILDRDPLADICNTRSLSFVMQNGRLYDAATLDEQWPRRKPHAAQWFEGMSQREVAVARARAAAFEEAQGSAASFEY